MSRPNHVAPVISLASAFIHFFSSIYPSPKVRDGVVGGCDGDTRTGNDLATPDPDDDRGPEKKKKRKRRRSKGKQQTPTPHIIVNLPSSSDEVEPVGECSKRDSSSSLGGTKHTSLRESLLTVLGKLVVWRGTSRYRQTPTSSTFPPNTPPATECIGRSSAFFSSGESSRVNGYAASIIRKCIWNTDDKLLLIMGI